MSLSRYEQETIINYNEEEKTAIVYTHNKALRRKLDGIAEERPDDCKVRRRGEQSAEYEIQKRWVKIRPNRILTDEQRERARERGMKLHQNNLNRTE